MFKDKLVELRKARGLTQQELAKYTGLNRTRISNYELGIREPNFETQELLADFFNVRLDYIMDRENNSNNIIPVLGRVVAGIPLEAVEEIIDYEEIPQSMARNGEYFALQIKGDSMEPKFSEGDVVIVRKQEDVDNGDIAIVLVNGNESTVKKIKKFDGGINLIPTNSDYEVLTYTADEIEKLPVRIIGKVVELRAKF